MDSTPPSNRSATRLAQTENFNGDKEDPNLDLISDTPKKNPSSPPQQTPKPIPLRDLLLLSPSPQRRSKSRLIERPEMAEEPADLVVPRRRCKGRASPMGVLGCASPRNNRRSRRRLDQEIREERELALGEENVKPRKRRQPGRPRKEKLSSSVPSASSSPKSGDIDQTSLDRVWKMINDLIMWKDAAKSTLWFGFGSLCFLSSCFTNGLRWSIFSVISQMGLIFLALSFFYYSVAKRNKDDPKIEFKLKEDDIVRVSRVFLPTTNLIIAKTREIFSGDPSTTLKVAPFLLFGAEYGHLITLWRLCAIGFFVSFTVPRLFSCYSVLISRQVEHWRNCIWEAWGACSHKKVVAVSAATVFWNLSSVKTRFLIAFISAVILQYRRQKSEVVVVEVEEEDDQTQQQLQQEHQQQQALAVVEEESKA